MVIQCPECSKKYKIDSERIPEKGAKISCPGCGHTFVVKKKEKEQAEARDTGKKKTPPCAMCGNPSTRVLKGDPPLILCEACFEREKEKRRRFEIAPVFEDYSAESDQESSSDTELTTGPDTGGSEDFFDSFAEIPDMGDIPAKPPAPPKAPAPPKPEKPAKAGPLKSAPLPTKDEEPMFDENSFKPDTEAPEPPQEPVAPPPQRTPAPPPPMREAVAEKPAPSPPKPAAGDEVDSDFVFSPSEVSQLEQTTAAATKPRTQPAPTAPPAAKFAPPPPPSKFNEDISPSMEKSSESASEIDRELFGGIAARMAPPTKAASAPKTGRRKISIPYKAMIGVAAGIVVLAAAYFVVSNPKIRESVSKLGGSGGDSSRVLSVEELKLVAGHLSLAQDLYKLDTRKSYMEALNETNSALKINPGSKKAKVLQMLVSSLLAYQDQNWFVRKRAKTLVNKADAETLAAPEAQVARVLLYLIDNDFSGAMMTADKLAADNPENALVNWVLAHIYLTSPAKDLEKAEPLLNKAIAFDPKLVNAQFDLAEIYFLQKNWQKAAEQFQEVLNLSPSRTEAAERLKEIALAQNQTPQPTPIDTKPGGPGGVLLGQGNTTQKPIGIPIKPETGGGSTATIPTPAGPSVQLDQEIQQHFFGIIAETRKPMSRVRTIAPAQPQPQPGSTSRPPEEAQGTTPAKPPEEAP